MALHSTGIIIIAGRYYVERRNRFSNVFLQFCAHYIAVATLYMLIYSVSAGEKLLRQTGIVTVDLHDVRVLT